MAKKSTTTVKTKAPAKKVAAKKKATTKVAATTAKPVKKAAPKKAPAKKTVAKKAPTKKAPAKKVVAKPVVKAVAKKVPAKKIAIKSAPKVAAKPARPTGGKVVAKTAVKADKKAVSKVKLSESEILKNAIVEGMENRKAENIVVMDLREVKNAVADFFVICQAESTTQVDAIADSVWDEVFTTTKEKPWHLEGKDNKQWILVDYVTVVAHIFQPEARSFYNLEKLWGDAEFKYIVH